MKNILRIIGLTLLTILLSVLIDIIFLMLMDYPGGEVGMEPFLILYVAYLALIPTLIFIGLIRIKRSPKLREALLFFLIVYSLIAYFRFEVQPFETGNSSMERNVDLWVYLSPFIASGLVVRITGLVKGTNNHVPNN